MKKTRAAPVTRPRQRLAPDERKRQILHGAVQFFAKQGFAVQTRELTRHLGISNGLLYRYFSSKKALIDKVYQEIFQERWNPKWEAQLVDRSVELLPRLERFYIEYAAMLHTFEWVRIYLHAGLAGASVNKRFGRSVAERVYRPIINELRHENGRPGLAQNPASEAEMEMMWALHGSIFYIGIRKWVYHVDIPKDVNGAVVQLVHGLLANAATLMASSHADASKSRKPANQE
ncbi:TetR/AcrR family transcriptional regulator [Tardiphaga sp.]|uniref:TetR/AcrR family transcriptional regulator n=1 Tax=Tardiphaga sp. TaxID=1926292 RepID=UPI002621A091|nr:TetR/AcrR family transcriptional regulator [Tardiphaga sp.]MDB5616505.1 hypothetical protein [Tardiphaga sp.]